MTEYRLELPSVNAYYDSATQLIRINYRGSLDAETPVKVYGWIDEVIAAVGIDNIQGEIFDFRNVTEFQPDNLLAARRKSRRMNLKVAVHNFPVAMIVKNFYHEEILRGPMQNVPENKRKTIVYSEEAALQFIQKWHAENEK